MRGQLHKTGVLAPLSMWRLLFSGARLPVEACVEGAMNRRRTNPYCAALEVFFHWSSGHRESDESGASSESCQCARRA
jgi:hypothetical protein